MKGRTHWLLLVVLVSVLLPVQSAASPVALSDARPGVYLYPGKSITVLADPSRTLTIGEAAASTQYVPMHQLRDFKPAYWLKFAYTTGRSTSPWYLFLGYKPLTADLYLPGRDGYTVQHSGLNVAYADRPVKYYGAVVFALPRATRPQTVYVRVTTIEPRLTIAINSGDLLFSVNRNNLMIVVGVDAVLLVLFVNALTFFLMSRDRIYLLYAVYVFAEFLYRTNDIGVAAAVLWPHLAFSSVRIGALLGGFEVIAATIFIRAFLRTQQIMPIVDWALIALAAVWFGLGVANFSGVAVPTSLMLELALVYVPVWMLASLVAWWRGVDQAWLLLVGWSLFELCNVGFGLKQLGIGRGNLLAEIIMSRGSYVGIAVQMLFLSVALSTEFRKLIRTKEELEFLSATDALTGIANRRAFEDSIRREWNRAIRSENPLSLLMLDVDFFKKYNDGCGHDAGDSVLRRVAQTGAAIMRDADMFCRYGGEEFVAILPDTDDAGARMLAQRLVDAVSKLDIPHPDSSHGVVTVSVGVATEWPAARSDSAELYHRADQACYAAKSGGRNRCEAAPLFQLR